MKKYFIFLLVNFVIIVANVDAATFVVSSTSDNDNGLAYSNPSTAENTLRKCIRLANAAGAGPHTITFAISSGPYQITLTNTGYQINNSQITIDATTQTGWSPAQTPIVILNGNGQQYAFQLNSGSTVIKGFVIQNFSQYGIQINSGSSSNTVSNCWIGLNSTGTAVVGSMQYGISISSNSNTIGSTTVFDVSTRNIIAGCQTGINIQNGSSNLISNNYIGTNVSGTSALANTNYGIYVNGTSASNTIGSTSNIPSNLISGNSKIGVYFESASTNNTVAGNYIGTNISGSAALANGTNEPQNNHGIYANNTQYLTVDRNVISGNIGLGIYLNASAGNSSSFAKIIGNKIGTDATGMSRIANTAGGIRVDNSSSITIGFDGNAASNPVTQRNIISGNGGATHAVNGPATTYDMNNQCGIYLFAKDNNITNVSIAGNYIGVKSNGLDTLGNKASGVKLEAANWTSYICSQNSIGGTDYRFRNIIGGNGFNSIQVAHGILLKEKNTSLNTITMNFIGIGADGQTPVGNRQDGISFLGGQNNTIGGAGVENVISNNEWGVFLQSNFGGVQASGNTIAGNFIGTDSTGNSSSTFLGNGRRAIDADGGGIGLQHGSNSNLIGTAYAANIIGENYNGIVIRSSGNGGPPYSNIVLNNYVGVGKNGTSSIANLYSGILISQGAKSNTIGSTSLSNVVINNGKYGIELDSAQSNTIIGNYIGVTKSLVAAGNTQDGINIHNGSSKNIIGGATGYGNYIGNNGGNGVAFSNPNASGSTLNAINNNSIFCNAGRGIVLNGGNSSYAAPTFSGTPTNFTVTGPAGSWIELYSLDGCNDCSTASNTKLQGKTLVASGASPLSYTPTGGKTNLDFTATASSGTPTGSPAYHNTSEFSVCKILCVAASPSITGTTAFCSGSSTILGVNSSWNTYSWTTGSSSSTTTVSSGSSVSVTVTDVNGCSYTATTPITIYSNPSVNAIANSSEICNGSSTTVTANVTSGTPTYTYSWSPSTGLSSTSISNPTASPTITTTYSVVVTDSKGCSNSSSPAQVTVTVNSKPSVNATANSSEICSGNSTTITAGVTSGTPNYTYSWTPSTGLSSTSIYNPTASPTTTTTYSVVVTDSKGCSNSSSPAQVTITVDKSPSVNATANSAEICSGNSTTVNANITAGTGTPGFSYSWSPSTGLSSTSISNPTASPTTTTTYSVVVTDSKGCSNSSSPAQVTVTVNSNPSVNATANSAEICFGNSTTVTAGVTSGTPNYTYSWTPSAGLSSTSISNPTANPTLTTTYSVVVTDSKGCSNSSSPAQVTVTVNSNPSVSASAASTEICSGNSTTVTAGVTSGTPNYTYSWSPSTGLSSTTIFNPVADPTTTTTYTVIVTDSKGCSNSSSPAQVTITVNKSPLVSAIANSGEICDGNSTTINANISAGTGTPNFTYSWSPSTALSSTSISNPTASPTTTTTYSVVVTDSKGCSNSSSPAQVTVTVNSNPSVNATANSSEICNGSSTTITAGVSSGTPTYTYSWSPSTGLSSTSISNPTASPTITTTYSVVVTDSKGCSNSTSPAQVTVTVNSNPSVSASANSSTICNGSSTTITAGVTSGTPNYTYNWTPSTGLSSTSIYNPIASPTSTTTYSVVVTDSKGCSNSTSPVQVTITVNQTPVTPSITGPSSVCQNGTGITFASNPSIAGATYTWTVPSGATITSDPTQNAINVNFSAVAGSGTITVTAALGSCADNNTQSTTFSIDSLGIASAGADVNGYCSISGTLNAATPNIGSGTWSVVAPGTATIDQSSLENSGVSDLSVGDNKFVWTVVNGACATNDTVLIQRNIATPTSTITSGDRTICGGNIAVNANAVSINGISGQWTSKPANITFGDPSSSNTVAAGFQNDTTVLYWTISGPCGNSYDSMIVAITSANYLAKAVSDKDSLCSGSSATINVDVTGNAIAPYTYYFVSSDSSFGAVTTNSSVTVTPSSNGWTYYYIYVMDSQNCKSTNLAKDSLYSMNKQDLRVPNLITPNLDGHNDCFIIKDVNGYDILPGSVFNLYNRWGEAVYRINNYKNGDFCGSILADGIYYYHLETGCGKEEIKGWLQIMSNTESLNK